MMKKSTKAILLSGLIFPGVGHLYLRRFMMAALLILVAGSCLYLMVMDAVAIATDILNEVGAQGVVPDSESLRQMIADRRAAEGRGAGIPGLILILCWLVGIFDCLRIGRQKPQPEEKPRDIVEF